MQQWQSRNIRLYLAMVLMVVGAFTLLGCSDDLIDLGDFREATAQDFATNSFSFPGRLFDFSLTNQRVLVDFGIADGTTVPYTMSFTLTTDTVISGTGIVGSIQFQVDEIVVDGTSVASTSVGDAIFEVGEVSHTFDAEIRNDGGLFEFRFFNPDTGVTSTLNNLQISPAGA